MIVDNIETVVNQYLYYITLGVMLDLLQEHKEAISNNTIQPSELLGRAIAQATDYIESAQEVHNKVFNSPADASSASIKETKKEVLENIYKIVGKYMRDTDMLKKYNSVANDMIKNV